MQPRLIRFRDAPKYLGMDRHRFNREVRPFVRVIRIGKQGIAFDRLDLDAWVDQYMHRGERPLTERSSQLWDAKKHQASLKEETTGTLINGSQGSAFKNVLELTRLQKRKSTLHGGLKR